VLTQFLHAAEHALRLPERPPGRWSRVGVSSRTERVLDFAGGVVVVLFAGGWIYSILTARAASGAEVGDRAPTTATAAIAAALTNSDAPSTAYLTDATMRAVSGERGVSGKLRVEVTTDTLGFAVDSVPAGARVLYTEAGEVADTSKRPEGVGVWRVAVGIGNAIKPVTDFSLITLEPFAAKRSGRIGLYYIGNWPAERGKVRATKGSVSAYSNPQGFIEVTPENEDTYVSEHFRLRDFLTHDQANVWPKYLVLQLRMVDKLELVLQDLREHGVDVSGVKVMSGFRTPQYNVSGGDPSGRAGLSRHMYGDAADIFIDSNHDGVMDDLNHDGRISINDSKVIEEAVDRVDAAHPDLIGGAGLYTAAPGHGPFIHIDTRGYRARWTGTGGG
jgi:hypothetical protein